MTVGDCLHTSKESGNHDGEIYHESIIEEHSDDESCFENAQTPHGQSQNNSQYIMMNNAIKQITNENIGSSKDVQLIANMITNSIDKDSPIETKNRINEVKVIGESKLNET